MPLDHSFSLTTKETTGINEYFAPETAGCATPWDLRAADSGTTVFSFVLETPTATVSHQHKGLVKDICGLPAAPLVLGLTFYRWWREYGDLEVREAKHRRALPDSCRGVLQAAG